MDVNRFSRWKLCFAHIFFSFWFVRVFPLYIIYIKYWCTDIKKALISRFNNPLLSFFLDFFFIYKGFVFSSIFFYSEQTSVFFFLFRNSKLFFTLSCQSNLFSSIKKKKISIPSFPPFILKKKSFNLLSLSFRSP